LNNPGFVFRPNSDVWLGGTVTDLGTFTETVNFFSGQTPSYVVEFKGQLPASFLADVASHGGLTTDFASATCGNGLLVGGVPEPTTLALAGGGLLLVGLLRRRIAQP